MFDKKSENTEEVVAQKVAEEKGEIKGSVKMIKEAVSQLQSENPEIAMVDVKAKVAEMYPELNKNTINTQISKIFASQDKEKPFKNALKELFQKGNIALMGDEEKIKQLIALYNSTMTVEEALAYLKDKPTGTKTLKISDLKNYAYIEAGKEESTDIAITFANTVIYARKQA